MFGKYFKHVLILTLLAGIAYSLPQVQNAMAGAFTVEFSTNLLEVRSVAAAAAAVPSNRKPSDCPSNYICIPIKSHISRGCPAGYFCALNSSTAEPVITVTYPQAGNILENSGSKDSGLIANIKWVTSKNIGSNTIGIALLNEAGTVVKYIANNLRNTGSYAWKYDSSIPNGKYQVEVYVDSVKGGYGTEGFSGLFSLKSNSQSQPSITVISPNGGETYGVNDVIQVSYSGENLSDTLKVYLYHPKYGNVAEATGLYGSPLGTGKGTINIGQLKNTPPYYTGQFKVTLCDVKNTMPNQPGKPLCDSSDNYFTIASSTTKPSITVTNPNGGSYLVGSNLKINWTNNNGTSPKVIIYLQSANNLNEKRIISSDFATGYGYINNVGSFIWYVEEDILPGTYNIIVADGETDTSIKDSTDSTFTISGGRQAPIPAPQVNADISLISADTSVTPGPNANDDVGTFRIKFKVTAIDGDVYLSSTEDGNYIYQVDRAGIAIRSGFTSVAVLNISDSYLSSNGNYQIKEGETETFELNVRLQLGERMTAGQYRMSLTGIKWDSVDTSVLSKTITSGLENFRTNYIVLN